MRLYSDLRFLKPLEYYLDRNRVDCIAMMQNENRCPSSLKLSLSGSFYKQALSW